MSFCTGPPRDARVAMRRVHFVGPRQPINTTIFPHAPPCGFLSLLLEWASLRGLYALHDLPVMFNEVFLGSAS